MMLNLAFDAPLATAVIAAIHHGDVEGLKRLLVENPGLATARIVAANGGERSLLHIATDWPGHFPNVAATIAALIEAGAEVNPPMSDPPSETPLHWAASSNDVEAIDALLDAGADIEAPGALLERGARTTLWQAAALGLLDRVEAECAAHPAPSVDEITNAFWHACRGGQQETARYLLEQGADLNRIVHGGQTALQAAQESGNEALVTWLRSLGAKEAAELQ
jgi:ankyrin repeat protein